MSRARVRLHVSALPLTFATLTSACASYSSTTTGPAPAKCQVSLSTSMPVVDAVGGTGNVNVTTQQECAWTAATDASWLAVASSSTGQGSGRVDLRVSANP